MPNIVRQVGHANGVKDEGYDGEYKHIYVYALLNFCIENR